eukprot:gnl/TRDRNA2_/TRDRNA2_83232_c0_seq1.p1 gnl/TRDRNA2_/TRDRNA2_83232_c0~~gnl/TRDRNA2_/TRDRNA2_83232_c0_seq1.p1  ORF type:complete len:1094 (-),score=244.86 gnl/TRDRNA2_/TRDRNA2_83232_c0_seq1:60-3341(-)
MAAEGASAGAKGVADLLPAGLKIPAGINPAHLKLAAGGVAAGVTGKFLFDYNRENYMFDQEVRFQRFQMARTFAMAQVAQYREDMAGLTEPAITQGDTYHTVSTIFMCVCGALFCAGRLGMHGCAPPGWFMGLYLGHIGSALLYTTLACWMAFHASLRAQVGYTTLTTRKVRLPVPSLAELDNARGFGAAFEFQKWHDIFRVPFMSHPEAAPELPPDDEAEEEGGAAKKAKSGKEGLLSKGIFDKKDDDLRTRPFASTKRSTVPTWMKDEQLIDKGCQNVPAGAGTSLSRDPYAQPDHFRLYTNAQAEWWPFQVYTRILITLGGTNFFNAICYYVVGTALAELRGFWIAWSAPGLFMTVQILVLRMDTLRDKGNQLLPHAEWFGHLGNYFAVAAGTCEYRHSYSKLGVSLAWFFVILSFVAHLVWTLRMFDLASPDTGPEIEMEDKPGKGWWPKWWRIPGAFANSIWIIAPPAKLQKGQACLVHEMQAMKSGGGVACGATCRRRRGAKGGKKPKRATMKANSAQELQAHTRRLQRLFDLWTEANLWEELPDTSKNRLTRLYNQFESAKAKVDELDADGYQTSGSAATPRYARMSYDNDGYGEQSEYYYDRSTGQGKFSVDPSEQRRVTSIDDVEDRVAGLANELAAIEDGITDVESTSSKAGPTDAELGDSFDSAGERPEAAKRIPETPWFVTKWSILGVAFMWFFLIVCHTAEIILGKDAAILKPPGQPPWMRDVRNRPLTEGWVHYSNEPLPADYRLDSGRFGIGKEGALYYTPEALKKAMEPHHRRLAAADTSAAFGELLDALPMLNWLAAAGEGMKPALPVGAEQITATAVEAPPSPQPGFMAVTTRALPIVWPALFEPRHLSCGPTPGSFLALSHRGFGATVHMNGDDMVQAEPFALDGILGPLAGASWTKEGLLLVSSAGELVRCPGAGPASSKSWTCDVAGSEALPVPSNTRLAAAAAADPAIGGRKVALMFEDALGTVALFADNGAGWKPIGEVHVPLKQHLHGRFGISFAGSDLVVTAGDGEVHRRRLRDGTDQMYPAPSMPSAAAPIEWRAACALPTGEVARLAMRRSMETGAFAAWKPELHL